MTDYNARQQGIWDQEWSLGSPDEMLIPGHGDIRPSSSIVAFVDFLDANVQKPLSEMDILDVGSGLGRNALYLASRARTVHGIDYSATGIERSNAEAERSGFSNVTFSIMDATKPLPLPDGSYDTTIDSLSSTSVQGAENRKAFAGNCTRLLKVGGLMLVRCVADIDTFETGLMRTHPGPDPNSSIWPGSNKFQKNFSLVELLTLYEGLTPLQIRRESKTAQKMGRDITATNWWAVLEKTGGSI